MIKKFIVASIKPSFRNKPKTHALKGRGTGNRSWCGYKFKRTQILSKKELTVEHISCQKCLNTINANLESLLT